MAGVNDWRFRLAEEEDRRRRKFGWDDLLGLLQTAAGIGTSIAGLKQSGERQALAQEQFDYGKGQDVLDAERQARLDAIAKEKHETGMHEAGYFRADPAMQGPMPSTAQTTSTGMTRLPGYLEDMAGRGATEDRQALFDEYSSNLPTGAELLPTGGGGYRGVYPPDYGRGEDATGPPEQMMDVPGTDYQLSLDSTQGRQMVLEMWRAQNSDKNPFDAAQARFDAMYGGYPPKDLDAPTELANIAAEVNAERTLASLAPDDFFADVLLYKTNIDSLNTMGAKWTGMNGDPAVSSALDTLIEILKRRGYGEAR